MYLLWTNQWPACSSLQGWRDCRKSQVLQVQNCELSEKGSAKHALEMEAVARVVQSAVRETHAKLWSAVSQVGQAC